VELEELHVLQRHAGAQRHRHAVTGVDVGVAGGAEDLAAAAGRDQRGLGLDEQRLAGLDLEHQRAEDRALVVTDEVDGEEFVEEVRLRPDVLLEQRVQDGVAGAVGGRAGACRLGAAEILALPAEGALVDLAVVEAGERHAVVLELVHRRIASRHMNSIASWSPSSPTP